MKTILPGATIGMLGGGQLGRMFAIEARKLGYRVHIFESTPDCPAGQVADLTFSNCFSDIAALEKFSSGVDVVSYEFENIPVSALDAVSKHVDIHPSREILHMSQNRRREKEYLSKHGFPVAPFRVVDSVESLAQAAKELGSCVLKTADFGYDGKGQQNIRGGEDLAQIWKQHGAPVGVVEKWITFQAELSVIVARTHDDVTRCFPVAHNHHENHILAITQAPAPLDAAVSDEARRIAESLARQLNLVGLLAVEMFLTADGKILINETAPRPHNSGHYSFDACVTSQFEQQLRAVCGLPLGKTDLLSPVLMHNILGDLWAKHTPDWPALLALPGLKLHLYGKSDPRPGRKMGHYCILAETLEMARAIDAQAQKILLRD
jgi:5-(carboxyamino)imidazole ribonucleotide synthase